MRRDIIHVAYTRLSHVPDGSASRPRNTKTRTSGLDRGLYNGGTELKAATLAHIQIGLRHYNRIKFNGNDGPYLIE